MALSRSLLLAAFFAASGLIRSRLALAVQSWASRLLHLTLGSIDLGLERLPVHHEQDLPLLDHLALLVEDLFQKAADPRYDINLVGTLTWATKGVVTGTVWGVTVMATTSAGGGAVFSCFFSQPFRAIAQQKMPIIVVLRPILLITLSIRSPFRCMLDAGGPANPARTGLGAQFNSRAVMQPGTVRKSYLHYGAGSFSPSRITGSSLGQPEIYFFFAGSTAMARASV